MGRGDSKSNPLYGTTQPRKQSSISKDEEADLMRSRADKQAAADSRMMERDLLYKHMGKDIAEYPTANSERQKELEEDYLDTLQRVTFLGGEAPGTISDAVGLNWRSLESWGSRLK